MGVNGLWSLLQPTSKAVKLESLSGKILAVDSSIWLFQFVKAMRDHNGNTLEGCHIIGFLHRINTLLYNGIKPIFVFDGSSPTLKHQTNREREHKRINAEQSLQKTAAKLLEATIKLSSLEAASGLPISKSPTPKIYTPKVIDDYELPLENNKPSSFDPRLATDAEIRDYIQNQNIAIDINTPEFYTLPNIVQHEIITNLKNKSRKPNFERVQNMVKNSNSALDFSKNQIANLIERAVLTQRYHDTLKDDVGVVHKRVVGSRRTTFTLENQQKSNESIEEYKEVYKSDYVTDEYLQSVTESLPNPNRNPLESYLDDYSPESWVNSWLISLPEYFATFYDPKVIFKEDVLKKSMKSLDELLLILNTRRGKCVAEDGVNSNDYYIAFIESAMKMKQLHPEKSAEKEELNRRLEQEQKESVDVCDSDGSDGVVSKFFTFDSDSEVSVDIFKGVQKHPILSPNISSEKFHTMFSEPKPDPKTVIELSDSESDVEWNVIESPLKNKVIIDISDAESMNDVVGDLEFVTRVQKPRDDFMSVVYSEFDVQKVDQDSTDFLRNSFESQASAVLIDGLDPKTLNDDVKKEHVQQMDDIAISNPQEIIDISSQDADKLDPILFEESKPIPMTPKTNNHSIPDKIKDLSPENIQKELKMAQKNFITISDRYKRDSRDASGVTNQMVNEVQELLQHFGIPYLNAPMEAESQCAFLKTHNLVDGIITDDSDVFLFGGDVIYRNVFNQKQKFVEQFTMESIGELGLNRNSLIQMAMLLGSDYTVGIKGLGPVSSIEVVNNWKSKELEGLKSFMEWAVNVEQGIVSDEDLKNLKSLVGKCKKLVFPQSFPDLEVYNAYIYPTVDQSKEKFEWKTPDLEKLRWYLGKKLGWDLEKIDKLIVPVVKEVCAEKHKQSNIESFFTVLPKKNISKRVLNATRGSRKRQK
jgi:DNA excision repair protein ERCC-5